MATIPIGGGRRVAPQSARLPNVSPASFGLASAQAVENIGRTVADTAQAAINEERRLQRVETERQRKQAEAAERARETAHLGTIEDQMRDAADEIATGIRTGQVDKTKAEETWAARAKEIAGAGMEGFRPETRPLVDKQINGLGLRLGNGIRKAREARDRDDVTAGLDTTLEQMQRLYRTDPAGAQKQAMATLEALGPFSNYTPQQLAAKGQGWREQTQFTTGYEAVSAARNDRKGLDAAEKLIEKLPDLDPQKRATLMDRAAAYRLHLDQQAELRAQRAEREAERRLKKAEAEFNTFQTLADKGTMMAPEYIDRALVATSGTPYQQGVMALAQQAKETGGIAARPVAEQRKMLDALDSYIAKNGRTPELDKRRQQVAGVLQGSESDIKADPLRASVERGVNQELAPLNLSAGLAGLGQQLSARVTQAERAQTWTGAPVSPLTTDEADNVGRMLQSLPANQRAMALQTIAATMPAAQTQALAAQIDKQDRALAVALGLGAARTTYDRPTAELVLKGAEALKSKTIKEESKAVEGWAPKIAKGVGEIYSNPQQAGMIVDAARYILAGKVAEGSSGGERDIRTAINLAVGGVVEERNGAKIVIPAGVDRQAFDQRLQQYPSDKIAAQLPDGRVYVRGVPMDLQQFLTGLSGAQLRTVGRGRYVVLGGGSIAANAAGAPVIIEAQ
jgi:hypothetical protein